ncbi:sigma factor [Amycolatopsis sp. VC5-11]|uniref:sigma factor n=1 Tax=Amycolatopsis sp. VC5-11 TaxID=3120156 RepID=UPI0030081B02
MTTLLARDRPFSTAAAANAEINELVQRAQQEIRDARPGPGLDNLMRLLRGALLRYCLARVDRGCAEDVVQETCAAVLKFLPRYRPKRGDRPFRAFVYGIAAHKVADAHRARARFSDREQLVDQAPETLSGERGPEERRSQPNVAPRQPGSSPDFRPSAAGCWCCA